MKLKVVEEIGNQVAVEADTIDTLKSSIMVLFSYSADHMRRRLLVREKRDLCKDRNPTSGYVDLLQLAEGYNLKDGDLCKDGDTLVLGWKGPCTICLESPRHSLCDEIKVNDSFTLGRLKRKIARLMGEPVTKHNLSKVLFNGDDRKRLLFFGFYSFCKWDAIPFELYPNKDNSPDHVFYYNDCFGGGYTDTDLGEYEYTDEDLKNIEKNKETTKFQFKENTNTKKKKKKKKKKKNDNNARIILLKENTVNQKKKNNNTLARIIQLKENTVNQKKKKKNNNTLARIIQFKENTENQKNNKARIIQP